MRFSRRNLLLHNGIARLLDEAAGSEVLSITIWPQASRTDLSVLVPGVL